MPSAKELAKALAHQGEIRNTPQNSFLGGIANFLSPVSEFADRDKLPGSIPLLGGMSFADLSGLKGSQSLIEDMSYGKSPVRGATLNTAKVDPRLLDLAAVSGAMIPVGKALGKAALREAALDPRMSVSHGLLDTTGLENRGRDLIRGKAEELAQRMHEAGVTVDLQHSGSAAGPSSYIKVVGMPDIRISGHSKGAFNSGGVLNVASPEEFDNVLAMAIKKQQKYNSQKALMEKMYEDAAIPIRLKSADKKIAKGLKLTNSEQDAVNVRAMPKPIDVGGAMMHRPTGLLGHPKLNVLPNERVALVEGNSNLRVEHKPDGTFTISHSPAWGETGKPFTLNGDSVDDLISTAESRLQRSEAAMTAAAKSKHSKTVGGMLEMKHGDNFEYAKSARSDSQYITHTPTGAKIRISDHKLPDVYESPDFEVSGALSKKEQAQSISKFLDDYATQRAKDDASIDVGGAMMQRPKTEFEILHDTAQRNAALPVEQGGLGLPSGNTAMDRAGAMGFDTPAYHGSGEELRVINNEKLKRNAYGKGLHSASDPELANIFANHSSQGQNVSPLLLRVGNQASKEDYKNAMNQVWDQGGHDATKIRQLLIDKGFDTVTYNHGDFHYPQGAGLVKSLPNQDLSYATLNPSQVRSRFAAFDPFRRHEADILAGVGVGGMLDPQAIAEALRQQDRK